MKYTVSIAVDGRIDVEVTAGSFDEAKKKALLQFMFTDLRTMEVVGTQAVNGTDENGKFIDY